MIAAMIGSEDSSQHFRFGLSWREDETWCCAFTNDASEAERLSLLETAIWESDPPLWNNTNRPIPEQLPIGGREQPKVRLSVFAGPSWRREFRSRTAEEEA